MFPAYHYKFQTSVEPVSVSPFSKGALDKAIGATLVSFFRNSVNTKFDWEVEPIPLLDENAKDDFNSLKDKLKERLEFIFEDDNEIEEVLNKYEESFEKWMNDSQQEADFYYSDNQWTRHNVVLGDAFHEHSNDYKAVYKKAPNSLREVEETTMFWV